MLDVKFDGVLDEFLAQLSGEEGIRLQIAMSVTENKDASANDRVQQPDERHPARIGG
jgi:hypothetical protein